MLAAAALRLAAIEALCPTEAAIAGGGFPTLAGRRVFDSRSAALEDLDRHAPEGYTPVLALYTPESGYALRASTTSADDTVADAMLDVVAELAVAIDDGGEEIADAAAATDPEARLVLEALCSQVRYVLEYGDGGKYWRRLVNHVIKVEAQTHGVPEMGLRWQRVRMRFHCQVHDDDFSGNGLPEPLASLFSSLPAQSYAKAKLAALAAHFQRSSLDPLNAVQGTLGADGNGLPIGVNTSTP